MKRFILLLAIFSLYNLAVSAQKKYEMVIEKTDGTEIVINVEDIVRTYFRERNEGGESSTTDSRLIGVWYQFESGYTHAFCFNADGTGWKGEWQTGSTEKHRPRTWTVQGNRLLLYNPEDGDLSDDFIYSISADGMTLSLTETQDGRSRGDFTKQ